MRSALVTGSLGLVGGAVTELLLREGWRVYGLDNFGRAAYFGHDGVIPTPEYTKHERYHHLVLDIASSSNYMANELVKYRFDAVVHAAAQPSHDLSATIPLRDFEVNALGTLSLLELARQYWKEAPFVFFSTNKVYGDAPNYLEYRTEALRYDFANFPYKGNGIPETFPIDNCTHSPFGCGKLSADVYVQEYGRYFGLPTCSLRCGCLTGERHAGAELHGFLAYLARCFREDRPYTIYGYSGRQVRDNLHATDVANFVLAFLENPRSGAVYNLGGGYHNSCSVLEAIQRFEALTGKKIPLKFVGSPRVGDHRVYYSDLQKLWFDYPRWEITLGLEEITRRLIECPR
jgi:CDP-paratose 2-epimerase